MQEQRLVLRGRLQVAVHRVDHDEPDIVSFHLPDQQIRDLPRTKFGGIEVVHTDAARLDRGGNVEAQALASSNMALYALIEKQYGAAFTSLRRGHRIDR